MCAFDTNSWKFIQGFYDHWHHELLTVPTLTVLSTYFANWSHWSLNDSPFPSSLISALGACVHGCQNLLLDYWSFVTGSFEKLCSSCPSFFSFSVQNRCSGSPTSIFCSNQNTWQKMGIRQGYLYTSRKCTIWLGGIFCIVFSFSLVSPWN